MACCAAADCAARAFHLEAVRANYTFMGKMPSDRKEAAEADAMSAQQPSLHNTNIFYIFAGLKLGWHQPGPGLAAGGPCR